MVMNENIIIREMKVLPDIDPDCLNVVTTCGMNDLRDHLSSADAVVCATSSEGARACQGRDIGSA